MYYSVITDPFCIKSVFKFLFLKVAFFIFFFHKLWQHWQETAQIVAVGSAIKKL